MSEHSKLKYRSILEDFLAAREWSDELSIDSEKRSVRLETGITLGDQTGHRLIIEASDASDCIDVYIIYGLKCRRAKLDEMSILLNEIHRRWLFGHFTCFEDGTIQWSHRMDFEGSSATGASIEVALRSGWHVTERFLDAIVAVAMTGKSAKDAIAEYDESQNK